MRYMSQYTCFDPKKSHTLCNHLNVQNVMGDVGCNSITAMTISSQIKTDMGGVKLTEMPDCVT